MNKLIHLDTTGENNLKNIVQQLKKNDCQVLISGLHGQPLEIVKLTGLYKQIGKQHFFKDTKSAIHYGVTLISNETCLNCRHFAFKECKSLSCVKIRAEQSSERILEDNNELGDAAI